jgi:hypothetical protein
MPLEEFMRKLARRLLLVTVATALAITLVLWALYRAAQQAPRFYREALAAPRLQHDEAERFERQALALHNQLQHAGRWEIRFAQEEINGWLAAELPAKFPELLPPGLADPRIAIEDGAVHLAVRYGRGGTSTVVSLSGHAHLTKEPNEVAIHLRQARAGLIPIPLSRFLREISERAARANIPLRWTEADGLPVALVRVPFQWDDDTDRRLILESLALASNELVIGGRIEETSERQPPVAAIQPDESETRQR